MTIDNKLLRCNNCRSSGEASVGKLEGEGAGKPGGGGEFRCTAAYPSAEKSLKLGRQNLHLFRLKNTRFDFIGGGIYFLIVVMLTGLYQRKR